jgi:hypothetical protein
MFGKRPLQDRTDSSQSLLKKKRRKRNKPDTALKGPGKIKENEQGDRERERRKTKEKKERKKERKKRKKKKQRERDVLYSQEPFLLPSFLPPLFKEIEVEVSPRSRDQK